MFYDYLKQFINSESNYFNEFFLESKTVKNESYLLVAFIDILNYSTQNTHERKTQRSQAETTR